MKNNCKMRNVRSMALNWNISEMVYSISVGTKQRFDQLEKCAFTDTNIHQQHQTKKSTNCFVSYYANRNIRNLVKSSL